ncbi:Gfo/Idh/MocA family oxidoreductase [Methanothrix soehngenii]|uniref:Gfo/Idh/MocA family oxidoreductase n=1 Tax=Methanothrix soehngenii TaxID=2223 RepID=UPI002355B375|nr:Gfo/Idh/MocA family oxidoreductase [Methanothrix soehngenii]
MTGNSKSNENFNLLFETVINKQLCCGCGTCVGVCPNNAIDFRDNNYYPEWFKENKCNDCGFCVNACPGKGLPLDTITKESKTFQQKYHLDMGNYKRFLVGHSKDEFIRRKSASGGIATSLLIYALDKNLVDKVIVVVNDENDIAKPIAKITASREDVLASMQSKYIQVPLNKAIKEILKSDFRYAIVGLPCHLEGLHLAQNIYKKMSNQIVFRIGLFCGYSYPYECVDGLLKRMGLEREEADSFLGWREGDSYPGFFSVRSKSGDITSLSFAEEHNIDVANYALLRCFLCIDGLSQLADISLGDSTDSFRNDSFIISRTDQGDELIGSARTDGYIDYYTVDERTALSKGIIPFMLKEKRHKVLSVVQYLANRNVPVPDWDIKEVNISRTDRINGILRIKLTMLVRKPPIAKSLRSHPKLMERVGKFIYHLDIDPKNLAFRMTGKFLLSHPKLMYAAKSVYHYDFNPKHIVFGYLQRIRRRIRHLRNGKLAERDKNRIQVGLIGIGGWGSQYIDILQKSDIFDLRVCFDINKKNLESVCSSVGCLKTNSLEELLTVDNLQAVVIVTPNFLHYEHCIKSIEQGKHVFIEKPIANTVEEAKKIYHAAKENDLVVSVGHNVRRRSEFRTMKKLIETGQIGDVVMVEANNSQPIGDGRETSWRLDKTTCPTGPLSQLAIHHIDTLRYLFGEIIEVKSYLKNGYFKSEVPDTVLSVFSFKSGVLGYLGTNYISEPSFTMRAYGTKGNLIVEDATLYLQKRGTKKMVKTESVNTLEEQIKEFGECIINNREPEVGGKEAIENMAVIKAIMESVKKNGKNIGIGE